MDPIPLPNQARVEDLGDNKYQLTLEPLYPGYGVTIGNTLRRVLLSSMPGAAVTAVKIKFVDHEFSTIPNIKEDVVQMILNLKQLRLLSSSPEPVRLTLKSKGEGIVTAAQIKETDQVQIVNKDLHIATLDNKNSDLDMELIVEQGRGYVPVESREHQKLELGMLAIDAIFTPIKSVYFDVTNVRVGQITNFDKLIITMETDGTLPGSEAADIAAHILVDHFTMIFNSAVSAPAEQELPPIMPQEDLVDEEAALPAQGNPLANANLSNRAKNALIKNGITTVESLEALSNDDINNVGGLGAKTIAEILTFLGREPENK